MEVYRQECQSCGSHEMMNIIVRAIGKRQVILVRCQGCGDLVARYELAGYYHHKKGIESYLRNVAVAAESAIDLQDAFVRLKERSPLELVEALKVLEASESEVGKDPWKK